MDMKEIKTLQFEALANLANGRTIPVTIFLAQEATVFGNTRFSVREVIPTARESKMAAWHGYKLQPNALTVKPEGDTYVIKPDWDDNDLLKPLFYIKGTDGREWVKSWYRDANRKRHTQWLPTSIPWEKVEDLP
jgi:hypothetical protein